MSIPTCEAEAILWDGARNRVDGGVLQRIHCGGPRGDTGVTDRSLGKIPAWYEPTGQGRVPRWGEARKSDEAFVRRDIMGGVGQSTLGGAGNRRQMSRILWAKPNGWDGSL